MNKKILLLIFMFLFSHPGFAQKVPRPGGGGNDQDHWGRVPKEGFLKPFLNAFMERKKICDPEAKVEGEFDQVYHYLYRKHLDGLMKDGLTLKKTKEICHTGKDHIIKCLMNKKLKSELSHLLAKHQLKDFLVFEEKLSKEEVDQRILFLKHLLD